jgi:hypothetical protein
MALNSRGEQIYYRVESDQDCMCAWRMERAVDHHMAVRERDLAEQKEDHEMKMALHLLFQIFQVVSYLVSPSQHISNKTDIFQPCRHKFAVSDISFCSDYFSKCKFIFQ